MMMKLPIEAKNISESLLLIILLLRLNITSLDALTFYVLLKILPKASLRKKLQIKVCAEFLFVKPLKWRKVSPI